MLFARLDDDGTAFETQRNLMTYTQGLDGGGSVAADSFECDFGNRDRLFWISAPYFHGSTAMLVGFMPFAEFHQRPPILIHRSEDPPSDLLTFKKHNA